MGMTIDEKNKFIEESKEHFKEWHDMNYIPKADYENRLKADMVAMLEEISLEIEEKTKDPALDDYDCGFNTGVYVSRDIVQQKIDKLKENTDGNK